MSYTVNIGGKNYEFETESESRARWQARDTRDREEREEHRRNIYHTGYQQGL